MRILFFGSRSLTWKHLPVMRALARHAVLARDVHLPEWLDAVSDAGCGWSDEPLLAPSESVVLLNGDGPPGPSTKHNRCPIGADRLAVLACMETWPERRQVRYFPVDVAPGASRDEWARAAAARDVAMAGARPDRAYCVHSDLDSSKGSIITARALTERGIPFWYVRVSAAGNVLGVQKR